MIGGLIMLSELDKAIKEFDTVPDEDLEYCEGELLGFSYFARGEINIVDDLIGHPYIRIGTQHYNSTPRIKANYRSGLATLVKKGFAEKWYGNTFILTQKGWNRAEEIVEDTRKTIAGYYNK
jgi:hypothetical protein